MQKLIYSNPILGGHTTLSTPDLVRSRSGVQTGSEQRAVECLLGPRVLVSHKVYL